MNAIRLKEKKRLPLWFRILTDLLIAALISGVFAVYYLLLPKKAESRGKYPPGKQNNAIPKVDISLQRRGDFDD